MANYFVISSQEESRQLAALFPCYLLREWVGPMLSMTPTSRILCVDGDPSTLAALKIGLERYGFDVIRASHGIDALMQFKANSDFDAVVTAHDLPQANGLELIRSVRQMGYRGRIILMANNLTVKDLRAYEPHAISGFFSRPFDPSTLATMLLQAD
jgi:CheY-like chemotaxis protein